MASSKEVVTYSSFPKINDSIKNNLNPNTDPWSPPRISLNTNTYPVIQTYDSSFEDEEEEEEGISGTNSFAPLPASGIRRPEVNLRNVILGLIAIVTGKNKTLTSAANVKPDNSGISFLGSTSNGDSYLLPSVYLPSAPPLLGDTAAIISLGSHKSVLEAEPPEWLPDSAAVSCMQCSAPFAPLTRGRHHCRFCGGVFCRSCTKGRCLLPRKFRVRDPERVCDGCYDRLDPVQGVLLNQVSNASQSAKHDVLDWTCMRGWLNLPFGMRMEDEVYKATNTLRSFTQVARFNPEKSIPQAVLNNASGLAVLTVVKAGAIMTYKLGTGLVVARRSDGTWSAPSSILSFGLGWGAQIGGELMDFIIVLHGSEAVKTFTSRMHFSMGAGVSAAAGPIGRVLEADLRTGDRGSGICYTYSCSKGAFVGVSLEGNFVMTRMDANLRFYGDPYLTTTDILLGNVERPKAATPLYSALDDLYSKIDHL